MRSVLSFISFLALGLIVAAVFMSAPGGSTNSADLGRLLDDFDWHAPALDYRSVVAGLAIGVVVASIAQISWGEVARRVAAWVVSQAHRLLLLSIAAALLGVIIFV